MKTIEIKTDKRYCNDLGHEQNPYGSIDVMILFCLM